MDPARRDRDGPRRPVGRRPRALARLLPPGDRPRRARAKAAARRRLGDGRDASSCSSSRSPARGRPTVTPASSISRCSYRSAPTWPAGSRMPAATGVRLTGASDHFVSEALYLRDPDHHGIEIYADRPRELWEGQVGPDGLVAARPRRPARHARRSDERRAFDGLPAGTTMGHVHLRVADVDETVRFYRDLLGFDLTAQLGDAGGVPERGRLPPSPGREHVGEPWRGSGSGRDGAVALVHDRAAGRGVDRRGGRRGSAAPRPRTRRGTASRSATA